LNTKVSARLVFLYRFEDTTNSKSLSDTTKSAISLRCFLKRQRSKKSVRFFVFANKKTKRKENPPREKIFTSLVCATQKTMPKKKAPGDAAGTPNITQFFGAASPLQAGTHHATPRVPAALPAAQPAQRNLKLGQIEARTGAAGGGARGRVRAADSDSEAEGLGEELRDSGTCVVLALCCAYPKRTLTMCMQQEKKTKKTRKKQPHRTSTS
jgi:hypothetical protein